MSQSGSQSTFRVADIRANPFRKLDAYPLSREKVEELRKSIGATGWWGNVVARLREDGKPELAYGHHRLEALRLELGEDAEVPLIIRDLDDPLMLQMMIRENGAEWAATARVEQESVRAVVEAFAGGSIQLTAPAARTPKATLRYAPGFRQGDDSGPGREHLAYTASTVAEYLEWDVDKVTDVLGALELIEKGLLMTEHYAGLRIKEARVLTTEVRKRTAPSEKAARDSEAQARTLARQVEAVNAEDERERLTHEMSVFEEHVAVLRGNAGKEAHEVAEQIGRKLREGDWSLSDVPKKVMQRTRHGLASRNGRKPEAGVNGRAYSLTLLTDAGQAPRQAAEVTAYLRALDLFTADVRNALDRVGRFRRPDREIVSREHDRIREALGALEGELGLVRTSPTISPPPKPQRTGADKIVRRVEDGMDRREIYSTTYQMRVPFHQFADAVADSLDVMNYHSLAFAADLCPKAGAVLDMCCGRGLLIPFLRYRTSQPRLYVGVDLEPKNAKWKDGIDPRRRGGETKDDWGFDLRFVEATVAEMVEPLKEALGDEARFDLITYTASIEHMQPDAQRLSLAQAAQVAAPGATLYLTCPVTEEGRDGYDCQYRAHVYEPKDSDLRAWLEAAGWQIDQEIGLVTKVGRLRDVLDGDRWAEADRLRAAMPRDLAMVVLGQLYPEAATEKAYVCSLREAGER